MTHVQGDLLTIWILGPTLVVWETLEHYMKKYDQVRYGQSSQCDVVNDDQSRSRRRKAFVEENQGELDSPERGDVESRSGDDHLHDPFEVCWSHSRHVAEP